MHYMRLTLTNNAGIPTLPLSAGTPADVFFVFLVTLFVIQLVLSGR